MFYRRLMSVPVLLLLFMTVGCAAYPHINGSLPDDGAKFETSKDDLWNQKKALEKEKADYQKRLADQQENIALMTKGLSDQQTEIDQTNKQISELNKSVDELSTQLRQLQEARQKANPLKESAIAPAKKEAVKPARKVKAPKKEVRKAPPEMKEHEPQSGEPTPLMKQLAEIRQMRPASKETVAREAAKKAGLPNGQPGDVKQDVQPAPPGAKAREPRSVDDLSIQMKQFEEAGLPKEGPAKETGAAQMRKEPLKQDKAGKGTKQLARQEPAETKTPERKAVRIKVLTGDGNIASARNLSKKLGKMGYRVKLIDRAPRSDFDAIVVYYGGDHRTAAEGMAKKLGGGAVTKPLTWSSEFDIIIVTGRQP
jgi:DNA repair exonuclease SbcCD ATPase subunit